MTPRLALIALMTLPLAACEGVNLPQLGDAEPQVQGHKGPPGVSPLEQPIETGAEIRPVSTAEPATYNTAAFSARGNEPFWAVDVAGSTAIWKTPDNQKGRPIRVNRLAFAQGVEYVGVHAGRPFVLNVRAAECQDTMADQTFPFTARLTVSGKTETGCASAATPEVAQAVAAIKAPAPAAPRQATAAKRPAA
uniref:COG3650 family protein n=1 Tax=Paracoccus shandongensis TaxID=2816048 RepID=UPI001A8D6776